MRSRYQDWSPLTFDSDPTPGNVDAVAAWMENLRAHAEHHRSRGNAANEALASVGALTGDHAALLEGVDALTSRAAGAGFSADAELYAARQRAESVREDLLRAGHRLEDAQQRLEDARALGRRAREEHERAEADFIRRLEAAARGALPASAASQLTTFSSGVDKLGRIEASAATVAMGNMTVLRADHSYTTAAAPDRLAPFGSFVSSRAEPNPSVADPRGDSIGGAESFSSDGDGEDLEPVDGHNAIGEKGKTTHSGFLNALPSEGHGYFDPRTQSLTNIAATTTGQPDKVSGGLTGTAAAADQHNNDAARYAANFWITP